MAVYSTWWSVCVCVYVYKYWSYPCTRHWRHDLHYSARTSQPLHWLLFVNYAVHMTLKVENFVLAKTLPRTWMKRLTTFVEQVRWAVSFSEYFLQCICWLLNRGSDSLDQQSRTMQYMVYGYISILNQISNPHCLFNLGPTLKVNYCGLLPSPCLHFLFGS